MERHIRRANLILAIVSAVIVAGGVIYRQQGLKTISPPQLHNSLPTPALLTTTIDANTLFNNSTPSEIITAVTEIVNEHPNDYSLQRGSADIEIVLGTGDNLAYRQVFVPVTHFSTLINQISLAELKQIFQSSSNHSQFNQAYLLTDQQTAVENLIGETLRAQVVDQITNLIDAIQPNQIALIPFDQLSPKLKVLTLDNTNILNKSVANSDWPLTVEYYLIGSNTDQLINLLHQKIGDSNRQTDKISTLVMTGVTAISRGVEYEITKRNDPIFPARGVMDTLKTADITHVDSENPLFDSCTPETEGIVLCGKTRSIAALKAIGVDVVDLTGNHQNDYGPDKNLESIRHLEDAGFRYFGGGKNQADAEKILYQDIAGTTLAFIGYNYFDSLNGPQYRSLAYQDRPGSNYYSEEKMRAAIAEAQRNADVVVVDFQFIESYSYQPLSEQIEVFKQAIDFGADIVVGVQAHQPQWIRFYKEGLIFYGLGNFFFDQMWSHETRQGIIPRFTFYQGNLVSTEILTTLLYDYAQPRFTSGEERTDLLTKILPNQ